MKLQFLAFLTLFTLASCSSNKNVAQDVDSQTQDSVGLEDENMYESEESVYEDKYSQDTIEPGSEPGSSPAAEQMSENHNDQSQSVSINGEQDIYTVEKGDTLMLISFKLYGDYTKWKSIQNLNPTLQSFDRLQTGTKLNVLKPSEKFNWQPSGSPYLIKRHDTLRKISTNLYETPKHWTHLFEHNKALIKDPNIIFAGFTLYYLSAQEINRDPANEGQYEAPQASTDSDVSPYPETQTMNNMAPMEENVEPTAQVETSPQEEMLESEMMQEDSELNTEEYSE